MTSYQAFHKRSIEDRDGFWGEQAELIHWNKKPEQIYDFSKPPFVKWFVGGETNLCYNAVDRHAETNPDGKALVYISTETNEEKTYSFAELRTEVMRMAAIYQSLGVKKGDRVLIYMPMIAEACFAMLACTRIGAIHSVVFGGFSPEALAGRIIDCKSKVVITADGDEVHIVVADNGPGVPEDIQAQLFTPFVTSKANGMGLGLVISRDIVTAFGGELEAEVAVEGGEVGFG